MVKTKNDLEKLTLSPSGMNTYFQCPRKWYMRYVLEIEEPPTSALLRGKVVHECIEDFFRATKYTSGKRYFKRILPKKWEKYHLKLETDEEKELYKETQEMLNMFATRHDQKIKITVLGKRVKDRNHAWNILRPKFREVRAKSEKHNIRGIIDAVEEGFDKRIFIVDYKTSSLYKHMFDEDYVRQLKMYSLMYKEMYEKYPEYLVLDYLRFGEVFIFPFKKDYIKQAEIDIDYVRRNTQSTKIEDYPCSEHKWCDDHEKEFENLPENLKNYAIKGEDEQTTLPETN